MRDTSMQMPPCRAAVWPSSEVPVPKGTTASLWRAQIFTTAAASAVDSTNATASGGTAWW